jgi:hypothetical protein
VISYLLKLNAIWRLLQLGQIRLGIGTQGLGLCIMSTVRLQLLSLLPMSPFGPHHRLLIKRLGQVLIHSSTRLPGREMRFRRTRMGR